MCYFWEAMIFGKRDPHNQEGLYKGASESDERKGPGPAARLVLKAEAETESGNYRDLGVEDSVMSDFPCPFGWIWNHPGYTSLCVSESVSPGRGQNNPTGWEPGRSKRAGHQHSSPPSSFRPPSQL